jgi:hypothetical protein
LALRVGCHHGLAQVLGHLVDRIGKLTGLVFVIERNAVLQVARTELRRAVGEHAQRYGDAATDQHPQEQNDRCSRDHAVHDRLHGRVRRLLSRLRTRTQELRFNIHHAFDHGADTVHETLGKPGVE